MQNRILLVEDDQAIADAVALNLKIVGYDYARFDDGQAAADSLESDHGFDLALLGVHSRYAEAVRTAKHDTLIFADRFPFRYMTSDYNLKYFAAFSGCSAESEASFKTLVFLADKLKELQLYKLMILDGSDGKIARAVIDTAGVADVKILTLNSMQSEIGENDSYLGIMENNLTVLQQALN